MRPFVIYAVPVSIILGGANLSLGTVGTVAGAHNTFGSPEKNFLFETFLYSEGKSECKYYNDDCIIMKLTGIICISIPMQL